MTKQLHDRKNRIKSEEEILKKPFAPLTASRKYEPHEFCYKDIRIRFHLREGRNIVPTIVLNIFQLLTPVAVGQTRYENVLEAQNPKETKKPP